MRAVRPDERRRCAACETGEMHSVREQALRGGGRELTWQCGECSHTVKMLSPAGRLVMFVVSLAMAAAVPWVAVTDRVAHEGERWWMLALVAALAAALIALFVRDEKRQRRYPYL